MVAVGESTEGRDATLSSYTPIFLFYGKHFQGILKGTPISLQLLCTILFSNTLGCA